MSPAVQSTRRPGARGAALLVMAVLVGLLAMHGLGPGPTPVRASATGGGHDRVMVHEHVADEAGSDCSHTHGGTGHADHADATCAAAGVAAPYTPPALTATLDAPAVPVALVGSAAGGPDVGRASPDLAELQLLRI